MSRGPGRIERAIRELFAANPDLAFKVVDLVEHCYPGVTESEKKHTVSVIRASRGVVEKDRDWTIWKSEYGKGGTLVFVNQASLQSHCLGFLMADYWYDDDRATLLARLAPGGRDHDLLKKRKKFVDLHIAERDGDPRAAEMKAKIDDEFAALTGAIRNAVSA
jgi:hypothetical protein